MFVDIFCSIFPKFIWNEVWFRVWYAPLQCRFLSKSVSLLTWYSQGGVSLAVSIEFVTVATGRDFADDILKCILLNGNIRVSINISQKIVHKGHIYNIPALVQIMAWHRLGDKPLSEPMMVNLLTNIYVTWPQWVKGYLRTSQINWNLERKILDWWRCFYK